MADPKLTTEQREALATLDKKLKVLEREYGTLMKARVYPEQMAVRVKDEIDEWVKRADEHMQAAAEALATGKPAALLPTDPGVLAVTLLGADVVRKQLNAQLLGSDRYNVVPTVKRLQEVMDERMSARDRRFELIRAAQEQEARISREAWEKVAAGEYAA